MSKRPSKVTANACSTWQYCCTINFLLPRRTADELIRLYNCFQPGITVQDIAIAQGLVMDTVDHRRLVTFGMVYGLLRRIHRYPISNRSPGSSSSPGPLSSSKHDAHEGEGTSVGANFPPKNQILAQHRSSNRSQSIGRPAARGSTAPHGWLSI